MKSFKQLLKNRNADSSSFEKISVALLSDQSSQFLSKTIFGVGIENSLNISVWEAPINQIEEQIYNPQSDFNNKSFQTSIIFESSHSLLKKYSLNDEKEDFANEQFKRIQKFINFTLDSSQKKIILFNFYELNDFVFGNFSSKNKSSFIFQLRKLNLLISENFLNINKLSILDISSIQNRIGSTIMFDSSLYINFGIILSLDSLPLVSKNIVDIILAQNSIFKKCLILDLDNTLWGGIIGDDGIENIQLGDLGIGKSFVEFQLWIKKLKQRGIIICICSKNRQDVAKNVFINHPDMKLGLEDISVFVANWQSKVDNIKNIQKVLNIGFDSIVFLDDNPYERDTVKENIPSITVPELPLDPSNYLSFLYQENLFETISVSDLDKDRTNLYQTEYERVKSKSTFTDLSDYMTNLKMTSKIELLTSFNIPRVSQLSQRSNQFNLRTIRYTENDLDRVMKSDNDYGLVFDLRDKFGSHGIISFVILNKISSKEIFIENWAMSCRVLERGMEQFILNYITEFSKKKGFSIVTAQYIETKKNIIVKDLYEKLGFLSFENKYKLKINSQLKLETKIIKNDE
jgi:FkbH-like protein